MKNPIVRLLSALLIACLLLCCAATAEETVSDAVDGVVAEAASAELSEGEAGESPVVLSVKKKATRRVNLGTTYRIEVPGKTVKSFTSKNKKVATVGADGVVTLKKTGKAKIKIKLSKKKSFVLTLKVVDPLAPTKITIGEGKKGTLTVGTPCQLTAVVEPAGATQPVKWKSSDPSVAAVDAGGLVTPVAAGTAKITATAGKVKATYTAKVERGGVTELSPYWLKSLSATVKALGGFKKAKGSGRYVTYKDGGVQLVEYREGKYKSGIGCIHVENTARYTLFGVAVGMGRDEVKALLKDYEGKGDYYEDADWINYSMHYPDVSDWFTVYFTDGSVSAMTLNCFTDM